MKQYKIVYYLKPDAENITVIHFAESYDEACMFAKKYRNESFSCNEVKEEVSPCTE